MTVRSGVAVALCLTAAACGDSGTDPRDPTVTAAGRVFTVDGAAPLGLVFTVTSLAGTHGTPVAADGTFELRAPITGDTVEYVIDAAAGERMYHPVLIRAPARVTPDLRIVLVPRRWTIDRGTYTGRVVAISLDAAFRPPCTTEDDANCDSFFPNSWLTGLKLWPAAALPVRVAFDRVRSQQPITATDSVEYWSHVQRMNADFGAVLFRPARYAELVVGSDGRADHAVLVRVDTTLVGFAAWTNWTWDTSGEVISAVVRPARSSYMRNSHLMTHELLHTQGFKHSCSWATVMGGYGSPQCPTTSLLSAGDVAHAHLALRVRDLQKTTGAPHGLIAALAGERKIVLGVEPFTVAAPRLRALRADGIGDWPGDHAH